MASNNLRYFLYLSCTSAAWARKCLGPWTLFCPFLPLLVEDISVIKQAANKRLKSVLLAEIENCYDFVSAKMLGKHWLKNISLALRDAQAFGIYGPPLLPFISLSPC